MKSFKPGAAILLALCTASCATTQYDRYGFPSGSNSTKHHEYAFRTPPMDPDRTVFEADCSGRHDVYTSANLRCM